MIPSSLVPSSFIFIKRARIYRPIQRINVTFKIEIIIWINLHYCIKGLVSILYSKKFSPFLFVKAVLNPYEEIIFQHTIKLIKRKTLLSPLFFFF